MLWTLRRETLEALDRGNRERFVKSVAARLSASNISGTTRLEPLALRAALERGIAACAQLQIEAERDVESFLELWVRSDEDIEGQWPWSASILQDPSLTARARLELIRQMMA